MFHPDDHTDSGVLRDYLDDSPGAVCAVGTVCVNCGEYGHLAINCPHPPQPRPGHVALPDSVELAAEISAVEGLPLNDAYHIACAHLCQIAPVPHAGIV
ncbi:MAG: hypothetical protein IPP13_21780 [Kouleothrix sp.]|jgi:hypothetical protein|nr:hypothetical protein [Kouleothrix sp.]